MLNEKAKNFLSGELCVIVCAILWGIISVFTIPLGDMGFSSLEITFVRSLLAAVFLGVFMLIKGKNAFKVSLKDLFLLAVLGIGCFMTVCLLYTVSIAENGSSVAAMLMYTSPVWTVIISIFLFKEKITAVKAVALAGVLGGCAMLSFGGVTKLSVGGVLIGLATGVLLALYSIGCKLAGKKYSAETTTFYTFLFSAIGSFFISRAWGIPAKLAEHPDGLLYFAGLSVLSTAAAYMLYAAGLKKVSAGKASMICTLEIVVATVVGVAVFGFDAGAIGYSGIAVTVLSLVFLEIGELKRKDGAEKIARADGAEKI